MAPILNCITLYLDKCSGCHHGNNKSNICYLWRVFHNQVQMLYRVKNKEKTKIRMLKKKNWEIKHRRICTVYHSVLSY